MKNKTLSIKRGTCILTEKPFVYVLKSDYRQNRCDYCLESKPGIKKCSNCYYVRYCNRSCQSNGWKFHKNECNNLKKIHPRTVPDAARIISRIILKLNHGGEFEKGYYTEKDYRKFRDLMSHYQEIKLDTKRMEHFECLEMVLKELLGDILIPNQTELLQIYGRMVTNSFNILDSDMISIGMGIYLGVSITDHSCKPNAVATFEGIELKIRVIEDLPCLDWSKIFISYIDLLNTTEYRQNELKQNYYFLCECPKCLDKKEDLEMNSAACPNSKCDEFLDITEFSECPKCKANITDEHKKRFYEVKELTKNHISQMKNVAYLDVCTICLQKQKNVLHPLNILHVKTLDLAFESAIDMSKWSDAIQFGEELIQGFQKYYGEGSPLLGIFYMKLGKIQLYEGKFKESLKNFESAKKILEVTHGTDHTLLREHLYPLIVQASLESTNGF